EVVARPAEALRGRRAVQRREPAPELLVVIRARRARHDPLERQEALVHREHLRDPERARAQPLEALRLAREHPGGRRALALHEDLASVAQRDREGLVDVATAERAPRR